MGEGESSQRGPFCLGQPLVQEKEFLQYAQDLAKFTRENISSQSLRSKQGLTSKTQLCQVSASGN